MHVRALPHNFLCFEMDNMNGAWMDSNHDFTPLLGLAAASRLALQKCLFDSENRTQDSVTQKCLAGDAGVVGADG